MYQCRRSLEVLAIELAVENMDEAGITKLQEFVEESNIEKDFLEYVKIDTSIHKTIMSYANNPTLENLLEQLQDVIYHNRNISSFSETRKRAIYQEHVKIVKALKLGDKEAAAEAMSEHVLNGYESIKAKTE